MVDHHSSAYRFIELLYVIHRYSPQSGQCQKAFPLRSQILVQIGNYAAVYEIDVWDRTQRADLNRVLKHHWQLGQRRCAWDHSNLHWYPSTLCVKEKLGDPGDHNQCSDILRT